MILVEVVARDLPEDKPNIRIKAVESVDSPVLGGIVVLSTEGRF